MYHFSLLILGESKTFSLEPRSVTASIETGGCQNKAIQVDSFHENSKTLPNMDILGLRCLLLMNSEEKIIRGGFKNRGTINRGVVKQCKVVIKHRSQRSFRIKYSVNLQHLPRLQYEKVCSPVNCYLRNAVLCRCCTVQ